VQAGRLFHAPSGAPSTHVNATLYSERYLAVPAKTAAIATPTKGVLQNAAPAPNALMVCEDMRIDEQDLKK
jgi:hypothetical protein